MKRLWQKLFASDWYVVAFYTDNMVPQSRTVSGPHHGHEAKCRRDQLLRAPCTRGRYGIHDYQDTTYSVTRRRAR